MRSTAGELTVTFNGEIYNFAEIKEELLTHGARFQTSSDTEVILEAYRLWGPDCLARFDGMFAFALWDAPRRRLFCARDRFGKKPFFYTLQQGRFHFASEVTALEQLPGLALTLDPTALMRYLAYEYAPTPQTMYKEVVSLPPAHWLLLEEGRLRLERYWDMPVPDEDETRPVPELCAELRHLLARAVRRRMVSDVPLGVFLSGGIDSTIGGRAYGQPVRRACQDFFHRLQRGQLRRIALRPPGRRRLRHRTPRARALRRPVRRHPARDHQQHGRAHGRRFRSAHLAAFRRHARKSHRGPGRGRRGRALGRLRALHRLQTGGTL